MQKKEIYNILSKYYKNYEITELLIKKTGFTKNQLFFCDEIELIDTKWLEEQKHFKNKGIPFEYIIQKAEFYGSEFYVDHRTLIPRNDTEIMVDRVLESLNKKNISGPVLIDVGTGSSCIALSVLKNSDIIEQCHVIDISNDALAVSQINIKNHSQEKNVKQHLGSLLEPLLKVNSFQNRDIFITANLPYIKDNDHDNMDKSTITYEPDTALYGGKNTGFELYEELIEQSLMLKKNNNNSSITLFIEIGFDQKQYSQNYLENKNMTYHYYKDNGGIDRCIQIEI